jgi:hypothetical protein
LIDTVPERVNAGRIQSRADFKSIERSGGLRLFLVTVAFGSQLQKRDSSRNQWFYSRFTDWYGNFAAFTERLPAKIDA